jgi:L-alanine-DL-glutamate epimerase-like enolase superfamily enzyme
MDTTVERIDRTVIDLPFREQPRNHMFRQCPYWTYFEIVELELGCGTVGYGEDMLYYGWGEITESDVDRALGADAAELLWDDSLGSLQIALFDAVAKALGVPVHELMGELVRDRVPVGWWCIDMPGEDWVAECETAIDRGYDAVKFKGRPWFDVREAIAEVCESIPEWFSIGIDFNETLHDADRALPVLEALDTYQQVELFESPIPQDDISGNRRLQRELDTDIAQHNGRPSSFTELTQLQTGVADELVLGTGGPNRIRREGGLAAMTDIPFWIQNLGMLTAVFWTHLGATLEENRMPNVFCKNLYAETPLTERIPVSDGAIPVPDEPGLGYEPDFETVERLSTDRPPKRQSPDRLIVTEWPDREPQYYATGDDLRARADADEFPHYRRGVSARLVPDNGTDEWERLRQVAAENPGVTEPNWW